MRHTIFCKSYRAMSDHETCHAGVEYAKFKGMTFDKRPCFCKPGGAPPSGCDSAEFPTEQEIAEQDAECDRRLKQTMDARDAIVKHLRGPWKRGMKGSSGLIDCPVCGEHETLQFSRSGYNGHIHARCITQGCVAWME